MPQAVFARNNGEIFDDPSLQASARTGNTIRIPDATDWIKAPVGTDYYLLPHHAYTHHPPPQEKRVVPVAAFLPPGYVRLYLPASAPTAKKKTFLPQFAYCAAGWHKNSFYVTAEKVDDNPFWDPSKRDLLAITKAVEKRLAAPAHHKNRLLHHLSKCALTHNCYTAQNIFLRQGEGGIPVSPVCNARCAGCISFQPDKGCPSSHQRISFIPTVDEITALAVPHLQHAQKAIISFGQGCEGEPTLQRDTLLSAIKEIRNTTSHGTIHINTNGSQTETIKALADAGLTSIRISMNSARKELYERYYRPAGYRFENIIASLSAAKKAGLFISINLLVFPGVSDRQSEVDALLKLIQKTTPDLIQMRNLNIDPDFYMAIAGNSREKCLGLKDLIETIKGTGTRIGYFNKPV